MFGENSPSLKNLLTKANNWIATQTRTVRDGGTTPPTGYLLTTSTIPTSSGTAQASPSTIWEARTWNTNSSTSNPVSYRAYTAPAVAGPGYGNWKLQYSLNNSAYTDALSWSPIALSGKPSLTVTGYGIIDTDNASTVDTLLSLNIKSSGNQNHVGLSFSGTTRSAWSVDTNGSTYFRTAGSSPIYNFNLGSTIGSQTLISQIYSNGYYSNYSNFNGGSVTAGSADTSVQTTLSTYGSFAVKGTLVTSSSYTLAQTETFVYVDPSNANVCTGTPTACNTYLTEGNCNAHTGVGCSWFTGNSCSPGSGTDSSTCTGQGAGCTWDSASCSGAANTDQTTCESLDDAYGGTCSWDTSTCPAQTSSSACSAVTGCTPDDSGDCTTLNGQSQSTCESAGGSGQCSWTGGDCSAFNNTDQTTCETGHTGCTWGPGVFDCHTLDATDQATCEAAAGCAWNTGDSTCYGLCTGVYDEGSTCSGNYFVACNGNLCNGDYNTGNCSGTYGAGCQGTANCDSLSSSGTCAAESGCTWTVGITLTLPTTANASRGTTGRVYSIMHVGSTGNVVIQGQSGEPIFQYTTLPLFKKGDKVLLHNQNITFQCSVFSSQTPCQAQTGCTWNAAVVCSSFGDQTSCESAGCTWDGSSCTGAGSAANCSGTYNNGARWYAHSLERGLNYVEKTANYTITDIDDIVNCTSNSFTLTLPSASLNNGKQYSLKNTGTGVITLNTTSSQTIDGNASGTLTLNPGESMTVISNNSNWIIV